MAEVLYTYDGKLISDNNPLPVKMAGSVDDSALEDYYTKQETDDKYQVKGDYVTKSDVTSKASQSDVDELQKLVEDLRAEVNDLKGESE